MVWTNMMACVLPIVFTPLKDLRIAAFHLTFHASFHMSTLISTILYVPILGMCALSLRCQDGVTYFDDNTICFSTSHMTVAGTALAAMAGLLATATFYKFFVFNFEPVQHSLVGKLSSTFDIDFHITRSGNILMLLLPSSSVLSSPYSYLDRATRSLEIAELRREHRCCYCLP